MNSWKRNEQFFRSMPLRSLIYFLAAVALLFAALGAATSLFTLESFDYPHLIWNILSTALFSTIWAWVLPMRMNRSMILLAIIQTLVIVLVLKYYPAHPQELSPEQIRRLTVLHGALITTFICLGYSIMSAFVRKEGSRFFEAHTEIKLASEIQRDLVPVVSVRADEFEAYGISVPSGAVGGDLVDVITNGDSSLAYVADVSGHGVKAGVFMSMIKASVRMRHANSSLDETGLLESLNEVLVPLSDAPSYATFAFVSISKSRHVTYSLAGHLPIFHFQKGTGKVQQCSIENVPVGMFAGTKFATSSIKTEPGDILALVTDGLTEVFDGKANELGCEYIEHALRNLAVRPLSEIADFVLNTCARFGKQTDDRTLLLVRLKQG